MPTDRPEVLLDVTRLISRSWTGRRSTGIDRVCLAYLRHFRESSLAVVQYQGLIRTLGPVKSRTLYDRLLGCGEGFRAWFARFLPSVLTEELPPFRHGESAYLNVSHTDFDLHQHFDWVRSYRLRSAYFIHDLIPITHPHLTRPRAVHRHEGRVRLALQNADAVIVSSKTVADGLRRYANNAKLPVPELIVSHLPGERFEVDASTAAVPDAPFFLCVGTIEPRKNHRLLLEVWMKLIARMGRDAPRLVMVGQTGPISNGCLDLLDSHPELADHVAWRQSCDDNELARLYATAKAVVMPSLVEGFGLPVVEALQMNARVIASDIPIFREIGQGIPLLLDPTDREGWDIAIMDAMKKPPSRAPNGFRAQSWPEHFRPVEAWLSANGHGESVHKGEIFAA